MNRKHEVVKKMNMLAKIIKGRGLSQRELAEQLGVTPAAVSQQVKHGIKSIRVAKKYARILNCNPLFLLD